MKRLPYKSMACFLISVGLLVGMPPCKVKGSAAVLSKLKQWRGFSTFGHKRVNTKNAFPYQHEVLSSVHNAVER